MDPLRAVSGKALKIGSKFLHRFSSSSAGAPGPPGFVYRVGGQLMLDGEPYRFVGADNIDILDWNVGGVPAQQTPTMLNDYFAMMAAGASPQPTVTRTFASEEYGGGNTDTDGFDQLARVVAAAEANGQKLILCLSNGIETPWVPNYDRAWYQGGYLGTDPAHSWGTVPYGSHTTNYFSWITKVCTAFKNSPAVMAWEVQNEPGSHSGNSSTTLAEMKAFFSAAAAKIKSVDPNHLVGVGVDSILEPWCGNSVANLQSAYDDPNLDIIGCHEYNYAYSGGIIGSPHVNNAIIVGQNLNKPVYVGETGVGSTSGSVTVATRASVLSQKYDIYFGKTQDTLYTPLAYTHPVAGVLFWELTHYLANGGTVTNQYHSMDPQEAGGTVVGVITGRNPWA